MQKLFEERTTVLLGSVWLGTINYSLCKYRVKSEGKQKNFALCTAKVGRFVKVEIGHLNII